MGEASTKHFLKSGPSWVSYIEPPKSGVPLHPMCAGREPIAVPMCLSQFLCSAHMGPAFRPKGSHTRVRLSVLVLSISIRFLSSETQSLGLTQP